MKSIEKIKIVQNSNLSQNSKPLEPNDGKGRCLVTWCNCQSFVENSASWPKCASCGHDFADHG